MNEQAMSNPQHYRKTVPSGENNNGTMLLDFVFKKLYAS
jgi:hypothetical protein